MGNRQIILIRRDDIVRNILARTLRAMGFEVRCYPAGIAPWVIPGNSPVAAVLHVPIGGELEAAAFTEQLARTGLPIPPLLLHAEDPSGLSIDGFLSEGSEVIPTAAPLSALVERLGALAGHPRYAGELSA
jgi:hypothetical protein